MNAAAATTPVADTTVAATGVTARLYLTPHAPTASPRAALLALIQGAKHTIDFGIFSWTNTAITDALAAASKRGVKVRGVADASQALTVKNQVGYARSVGIDVRVWGSSGHLFHDKVLLVDAAYPRLARLALGSYNWTGGAENDNNEVLTILSGTAVSKTLAPPVLEQLKQAYAEGRTLS